MTHDQFFLGRQPVVGRNRELVAYELLFRSSQANAATVLNDVAASAAVIQYAFSDLGVQSALGDKRGFINLSEALLMSDIIEVLPPKRVVLEILETVPITPKVVARCRQLKAAGYRLALDDVIDLSDAQKTLLPLISIVKFDMLAMPPEKVAEAVRHLRPYGVTLLAEKIETMAQYDFCRDMGFDLFQGYFFAKPVILSGRAVQPSTMVLLKLFGMIASDAGIKELETAVKQAPDLALRLLKMVNSAAFGLTHKIYSVRKAIFMLGRVQLSRLVQIMLFAQHHGARITTDPLLQTAAVRGRLMEGLAGALGWQAMKERAFMVGVLSLLDVLFHQPLTEIVTLLNMDNCMCDALLRREGPLGLLLQLVVASERAEDEQALALMRELGLSDFDRFNRLQVEALKWASDFGE